MHQNRINESRNMLHYSNASSIEENRRYLVIKVAGLAWLLWQEGRVTNTVVELGVASSLGVYPTEVTEREHNK